MHTPHKIVLFTIVWIHFLVCPTMLFSQTTEIKGIVFNDENGNLKRDGNEKGIPNVVVSDQVKTTVTDSNGTFVLHSENEFPYLVISQPTGYTGSFFSRKESEMTFPLQRSPDQSTFKFIHASDTHVDANSLPRIQRFREMADSLEVGFVIITGDLIKDALRVNEATAKTYYEMFKKEITKFKAPVYSGVGNHELFGIERDKSLVSKEHPLYGKKMYRYYLGPNYYSFNYGGIHFISIDGVGYQNLYYYGGVDETQLAWLEKDLEHLDLDTPVVTFNHIPFVSPGFSFQDFENDAFYGPQLLEQSNKLEHRHIVHNFKEVQRHIGKRPYPLALAGHYHAPQISNILGSDTQFAQTAAITGPDTFSYNGFEVRSGFTLYEIREGTIYSSKFIPLTFNK